MVTVKFYKRFPMTFFANLDFQRAVKRTLKRANVKVGYTQGFTPHMDVDFTAPIPMGVESDCEYMTVNTTMDAKEFCDVFSANAPQGIGITAYGTTDKGNVSAMTYSCRYDVKVDGKEDEVLSALSKDEFVITYEGKSGEVSKNVKDKILSYGVNNGVLTIVLTAGNDNLRADRVCDTLNRICGLDIKPYDIVKKEVFAVDTAHTTFDGFWDLKVYEK